MLHTVRCKRAIWGVWSTPWRQRAIGKVWGIWAIAHANVWISHGLVPAARHANLGLAHREMLPGLGRRDRVLDMLEVVGLDRPVRPRAGRNTRLDDFGHTTGRRDGHRLAPVREEGLPLTRRAARSGCRACEEVDGLFVKCARILHCQRKEGVALELHEMHPVVALRRRASERLPHGEA